jgi:hypothetical protein
MPAQRLSIGLSRFAQTHVGLAPLRARTAHMVQLGTISLIGQHCRPIMGELSGTISKPRERDLTLFDDTCGNLIQIAQRH